jgi:hypothetical protein
MILGGCPSEPIFKFLKRARTYGGTPKSAMECHDIFVSRDG